MNSRVLKLDGVEVGSLTKPTYHGLGHSERVHPRTSVQRVNNENSPQGGKRIFPEKKVQKEVSKREVRTTKSSITPLTSNQIPQLTNEVMKYLTKEASSNINKDAENIQSLFPNTDLKILNEIAMTLSDKTFHEGRLQIFKWAIEMLSKKR